MKEKFSPTIMKAVNVLEYLHDRWQDEMEYEDWGDYVKYFRSKFPRFTHVKIHDYPFVATFDHARKMYKVIVTTNGHLVKIVGEKKKEKPIKDHGACMRIYPPCKFRKRGSTSKNWGWRCTSTRKVCGSRKENE